MPYFPAMAILTGVGLSQIKPRWARVPLVGAIAAYALFQFAGLTVGLHQWIPSLPTRVEEHTQLATFTFYAEDTHIASPPKSQDWKGQEILTDVMNDVQSTGRKPQNRLIRLVCMPDSPYLSPLTLLYFVRMRDLPIDVVSAPGIGNTDIKAILQMGDYVMSKTGNQGPEWTTHNIAEFSQMLADPNSELGKQFVAIAQHPLPDGSTATIYRKK